MKKVNITIVIVFLFFLKNLFSQNSFVWNSETEKLLCKKWILVKYEESCAHCGNSGETIEKIIFPIPPKEQRILILKNKKTFTETYGIDNIVKEGTWLWNKEENNPEGPLFLTYDEKNIRHYNIQLLTKDSLIMSSFAFESSYIFSYISKNSNEN